MNSIRPLVTITILVVVGAFLYVKINQGPVRPPTSASEAWTTPSTDGVPPLSITTNAAAPATSAAPPWSAEAPAASLSADTPAAGTVDVAAQQPPAVPPIPDLPSDPVAPETSTQETVAATVPAANELPASVPMARYPDQPAASSAPASAPDVMANAESPTPTTPAATEPTVEPVTPEDANRVDVAATSVTTAPLTAQQNPLRESADPLPQTSPTSANDRYGIASAPTDPVTSEPAATTAQASFATSWPTIQTALNQGELARAHEMLSKWHNDPTLTPTDTELVNTLLSQLAGTVIYSTEHQLEPAYVVKQGDTLETIARECNVPWQLLAKINGIPAADQIRPGQELKLVRGPFSAVIDVGLKQMTLTVGDRYAGKFPVTVPSMSAVNDGPWVVEKKLVVPSDRVTQSAYTPGQAAVDRAIVLRSDAGANPAAGGATLTIASGSPPSGSAAPPAAIRVSPQDAAELTDILSIGSRVVIQR